MKPSKCDNSRPCEIRRPSLRHVRPRVAFVIEECVRDFNSDILIPQVRLVDRARTRVAGLSKQVDDSFGAGPGRRTT